MRMSVCYGDNYVFELYISKNTLRDIIDQCVKCVECVMENFPEKCSVI